MNPKCQLGDLLTASDLPLKGQGLIVVKVVRYVYDDPRLAARDEQLLTHLDIVYIADVVRRGDSPGIDIAKSADLEQPIPLDHCVLCGQRRIGVAEPFGADIPVAVEALAADRPVAAKVFPKDIATARIITINTINRSWLRIMHRHDEIARGRRPGCRDSPRRPRPGAGVSSSWFPRLDPLRARRRHPSSRDSPRPGERGESKTTIS